MLTGPQYPGNRAGIYNEPGWKIPFKGTDKQNWYPMARYMVNGIEQIEYPNVGGTIGSDPYPIGVIIDKDYNPYMIEVNAFPNLSKVGEVSVKIKMLNDFVFSIFTFIFSYFSNS